MVSKQAGAARRWASHAARFSCGQLGVFQGTRSFVLQDDDGQIATTHSISAGLDYAAVGPEHAQLHDVGRIRYGSVDDREALEAFHLLSRTEGIIPALESAHAVAEAVRQAPKLGREPRDDRESFRPRGQRRADRRGEFRLAFWILKTGLS